MNALIADGLTKMFGDMTALYRAKIALFRERITGFLGPNGAGKTTLFNIVSGDIKPDEGRVQLLREGRAPIELTRMSRYEVAREGIGYLYQGVRLFSGLTVLENVIVAMYKKKEESPLWDILHAHRLGMMRKRYEDEARHWIRFVGLSLEDAPYDILNRTADRLSFGEKKLLSLAQVLAADFDILLLDEPTAGLNEYFVRKIEDLILEIARGMKKTVAIIEHNVRVLERIADFVYFLADGRIVFFGRTDHVLGNEEVRATYIGID